jgi:2-polyprenyl-3-methyl-5-hydroxy-6-metoxy-1,4-benzoquinol methylase
MSMSDLYNAYYYERCLGPHAYARQEPWLNFFDVIAARIHDDIGPETVLDVGCGIGMLVEALHRRGIKAYGFDVSEYALSLVPEEYREYVWQGKAQQDGSYRACDLIVCIEVVEHLFPSDADYAIGMMCRYASHVLFSSNPNDYHEATHVNTRPVEYWAQQFARYGFFRYLDFDATFISQWAALYRRVSQPVHMLVRDYEREIWNLKHQVHEQRAKILDMQQELSRE